MWQLKKKLTNTLLVLALFQVKQVMKQKWSRFLFPEWEASNLSEKKSFSS
jgi:hypothetical protein